MKTLTKQIEKQLNSNKQTKELKEFINQIKTRNYGIKHVFK